MSAPLIRHKQQKELQTKADTLRAQDSFKEAVGSYLNSILIDRNNADTYFGLGVCYKNLGKTKKAIEYLEKAILLDNNRFDSFFELGLCHLKEETPCKAIKCFIQAIQIEPDNPEAIYQLGLAHEQCDEEDMALMIYQKLIENSPMYLNAYLRKSELLMKMEMYKQALSLNFEIMKINPNYTKVYSSIGLCLDKLGKTSEAKRYYRKFLASQPQAENANQIMRRVEKLRTLKKSNSALSLV
jgi:superkiller protein 3